MGWRNGAGSYLEPSYVSATFYAAGRFSASDCEPCELHQWPGKTISLVH